MRRRISGTDPGTLAEEIAALSTTDSVCQTSSENHPHLSSETPPPGLVAVGGARGGENSPSLLFVTPRFMQSAEFPASV